MVQWLRLCTPNAGGLSSIPSQETRSHMPQLRVHMPQPKTLNSQQRSKIPSCPKTWCIRRNKYLNLFLKKERKKLDFETNLSFSYCPNIFSVYSLDFSRYVIISHANNISLLPPYQFWIFLFFSQQELSCQRGHGGINNSKSFSHYYCTMTVSQVALVVKNPPASAEDKKHNPCVEKIPWRRKW